MVRSMITNDNNGNNNNNSNTNTTDNNVDVSLAAPRKKMSICPEETI